MFLARMVFFRLHESPRYLVHAGRPQDALESLQMISKFNGSELELNLGDVEDRIRVPAHLPNPAIRTENGPPPSLLFDADDAHISSSPTDIKMPSSQVHAGTPLGSSPLDGRGGGESSPLIKDYSATAGSGTSLAATARHSIPYSATGRNSFHDTHPPKAEDDTADDIDVVPARQRRPSRRSVGRPRADTFSSVRSSFYEAADHAYWAIPRSIRRPLRAWFGRFKIVLEPEWRRTTLLVWGAWCGTSLAYTMFNVYLPKLLETRHAVSIAAESSSLQRILWDVVIFTIGGCPGAVVSFALVPPSSFWFPLLKSGYKVGRVVD